MITVKELYRNDNILKDYLCNYKYPFEILSDISKIIFDLKDKLDSDYKEIKENVWIHESAKIDNNVEIIGPCIIMENCILRHNAYIRGNVIVGPGSLIGNSEIKNSILLGNDKIPHFNYVGDSILGENINFGAGSKVANLRFDRKNIKVDGELTNLNKIGAFIGNNVEIGCNAVIAPGSVILDDTIIYPLTFYRKSNIKVEKL